MTFDIGMYGTSQGTAGEEERTWPSTCSSSSSGTASNGKYDTHHRYSQDIDEVSS